MEYTNENYVTAFIIDNQGFYTGAAIPVLRTEITEDTIITPPRYPRTSPVINKWNKETKTWEDVLTDEGREQIWGEVKIQRNLLIAQTDWTQCADVNLSDEKKQQMLEYRQALRDLTKNNADPRFIAWPDKPF